MFCKFRIKYLRIVERKPYFTAKPSRFMAFIDLAEQRYSVRKYSDKPIEKEKLDLVLKAGNLAPTAVNAQPQRIYVIQSPEVIAKMAEITPMTFDAKTILAFAVNTDEEWNNPLEAGIKAGIQDVSIVATHMMMEATELGLGTCWVCYFPNTPMEKILGLPANEKLALLMPIGYPAEDAEPRAGHFKRKEISETVRFI